MLVNKLPADELGTIPIVVFELNTRPRLGIFCRNLKYLHKLFPGYVERDECVLKRQQLEDVAGAQVTGADVVFTQTTRIHDREHDGFSEFRCCLRSHAVADEVAERACAHACLAESAFESSDHLAQ